ncbi:MAG: DUF3307 domain-containing protein [Clostridiales bacterium]|nr:DUF3307 domain-containing protein [Clostridiales bacterium]
MKAFTLLFLAHILGDYYFQPAKLAERKSRGIGWVLLHALIYAATFALSLLLLGGGYIWAVAICAGTHLVIDVVKQLILNARAKQGVLTVKGERAAFCIDQILHITIILASSVCVYKYFEISVPPFMDAAGKAMHIGAYRLLTYAGMGLAVMKPANVFVKRMLVTEKPDEGEPVSVTAERRRAGAYIGALERLLAIALMVFRQYGAIALVFTAKSIARFRQLDDREFAEYYIFGTLLSAATAIGVFVLLKLFGA